jgi:hypothetical protein
VIQPAGSMARPSIIAPKKRRFFRKKPNIPTLSVNSVAAGRKRRYHWSMSQLGGKAIAMKTCGFSLWINRL